MHPSNKSLRRNAVTCFHIEFRLYLHNKLVVFNGVDKVIFNNMISHNALIHLVRIVDDLGHAGGYFKRRLHSGACLVYCFTDALGIVPYLVNAAGKCEVI